MSSLTERLDAAATFNTASKPVPKPDSPGYAVWDGEAGTVCSRALPAGEKADWGAILRELDLNPAEVMIVGHPEVRSWDAQGPGGRVDRMRYFKAKIALRAGPEFKMPSLDRLVKRARPKPPARTGTRKAVVVAFADPQVGKVASRGGTQELIERVGQTYDLLDAYLREQKPVMGLWADLGDIVEEFNSQMSQRDTNDRSLMDQIELASDLEHAGIKLLANHCQQVTVAGVGSNHCRWRQGKNNLGTPADDWGLHILRQLKKRYADNRALAHIEWAMPKKHEEAVTVDVLGVGVGIVHGHQAGHPDRLGEWWARQVHGGQALASADVLLAGHFHNFRTYPSGRSPWSGREKRVWCAPTLDNGSDWFANIAGADSDPGLLVLTITEGVGVTDARVLRPGGWQ